MNIFDDKCWLRARVKVPPYRKGSEDRRQQRPRQKTPKPSPDYYDDYYYDHAPWPQKRQGYGEEKDDVNNCKPVCFNMAGGDVRFVTYNIAMAHWPMGYENSRNRK